MNYSRNFILIITVYFIAYLLGSAIEASFDISEWEKDTRKIAIILSTTYIIISIVGRNNFLQDD